MRLAPLAIVGVLGIAASAFSAQAAPMNAPAAEQVSNIVQVAQGCGRGFHRNGWGHCRPNRWSNRWSANRGYGWRGYYGGGSPSDHVANQLNRRELGRWGY